MNTLKSNTTAAFKDYGATPRSELSYSYSEMVGEMEGSNFMGSKFRNTGNSYLKNNQQTLTQSNALVGSMTKKNDIIVEEEEERNSSHQSV
jgi:hypothetical protein